VIASEDERFFSHGAIDFPSTVRAAWHFSLGDRQGGSTFTQQLARSILLKKDDSLERSWSRRFSPSGSLRVCRGRKSSPAT